MIYSAHEKTPVEAVDDIKEFIIGKVVCDLGCGDGDFMLALAQFASRVIGIERDETLVAKAVKRGLQVKIGDITDIPTEAEVLFVFMSFYGTMKLTTHLKKIGWKGTLISHYYPLHELISMPWHPSKFVNNVCPLLIYELV